MFDDSALAERLLSSKGRIALYAFGFSIIGALGVYGVLSTEEQAAWAAVLAALLPVATLVFTHITPDEVPVVPEPVIESEDV